MVCTRYISFGTVESLKSENNIMSLKGDSEFTLTKNAERWIFKNQRCIKTETGDDLYDQENLKGIAKSN